MVSQIHADGAAEKFIDDLKSVRKSFSVSKIKNKFSKIADSVSVNALKKTGYRGTIKKTIGC